MKCLLLLFSQVKSSHPYLYSAFYNADCFKAASQWQQENNATIIKSYIVKYLASPTEQAKGNRATVARNPNSIMEKKTLGEARLSRGASSPLANGQILNDFDSGNITGQK
ncbi:MAG: hypothetical protein ACRDAQ_05345 [Cetobacterium sp.]